MNSCKAYLIQIGTNKTSSQINKIKTDLNENESNYKEGIQTFTDWVELVFIFDKDTQIGLKNKNEYSGAQYCIENILFYLFSIEDSKLYCTNDMELFFLLDKFEASIPKKIGKDFIIIQKVISPFLQMKRHN